MDDTSTNTASTEPIINNDTAWDLFAIAWTMAGKSLFYMQYLHCDTDFGSQVNRIKCMCYHLTMEHKAHLNEDTEKNRQWFKDWIDRFADEVDNQC